MKYNSNGRSTERLPVDRRDALQSIWSMIHK